MDYRYLVGQNEEKNVWIVWDTRHNETLCECSEEDNAMVICNALNDCDMRGKS